MFSFSVSLLSMSKFLSNDNLWIEWVKPHVVSFNFTVDGRDVLPRNDLMSGCSWRLDRVRTHLVQPSCLELWAHWGTQPLPITAHLFREGSHPLTALLSLGGCICLQEVWACMLIRVFDLCYGEVRCALTCHSGSQLSKEMEGLSVWMIRAHLGPFCCQPSTQNHTDLKWIMGTLREHGLVAP